MGKCEPSVLCNNGESLRDVDSMPHIVTVRHRPTGTHWTHVRDSEESHVKTSTNSEGLQPSRENTC